MYETTTRQQSFRFFLFQVQVLKGFHLQVPARRKVGKGGSRRTRATGNAPSGQPRGPHGKWEVQPPWGVAPRLQTFAMVSMGRDEVSLKILSILPASPPPSLDP